MNERSNHNLVHIATILYSSMMSLDYFDNMSEIVAKRCENSDDIDEIYEWAIQVDESIRFINSTLKTNISMSFIDELNKHMPIIG